MAKAATVAEPPAPAVDPAESDVFDAVLPEVAEGEQPLRLEPEAPEGDEPDAPEPKPAPAKAAKAAPAKSEEPAPVTAKQPPLDPAAREERAKRKQYARLWETAASERDEALAQLERLRTAPNTAANREARKLLVEKADAAGSMGGLTELLLEEFDKRDAAHRAELFAMAYEHAVRLSDVNARIRHPDYDEMLQKAGILDAVQVDPATRQWKDPNIAKRIYHNPDGSLRADPGEYAYRLAVGKLEYEAGEHDEPVETPAAPARPAPTNGAKAVAPSEDAVAAARREGAREVQEKVVSNASRPKGIGGIRSAGPPGTSRLSRQQLDELMEKEPRTYERLVKANPELERWHLGG